MRVRRWFAVLMPLFILTNCSLFGVSVATSPVPLHRLLVEVADYPSYWKQEGAVDKNANGLPGDEENISIAFQSTSSDNNISVHTVWRFPSSTAAQRAFELLVRREVKVTPPPKQRAEVGYQSHVADQYIVLCNDAPGPTPMCVAVARYGAYVSEFSAYVDSEPSMRYADYDHVLSVIDQHMDRAE